MGAIATYAEHYGTPDPRMSWWLFLGLLGQVSRLEVRALMRAIQGPAQAMGLLSEDGAFNLKMLMFELEERA